MSPCLCGQREILWKREAIVFAPMFARIFVTPPQSCFRSSYVSIPTCWDGTDPLLGGLVAVRRGCGLVGITVGGQQR
jgi:hypothetical protein